MAPLPRQVIAARQIEYRGLILTARSSVKHAETEARTVRIRRLGGRRALEEIPAHPVAVHIIELIVERRLRISQVPLERRIQPRLHRERTVGIDRRRVRHNRRHRPVFRAHINARVARRRVGIARQRPGHLMHAARIIKTIAIRAQAAQVRRRFRHHRPFIQAVVSQRMIAQHQTRRSRWQG